MIRKAFEVLEFIGDCCFAVSLFAEYVFCHIARLVWCVPLMLALPLAAHAGGYCNSCQHAYVQHEVSYVPQTVIEHQNNEIFYQVPNAVQQYAVTPGAIAQAKLGELERQAAATRDRIAEYQQLIQQQQPQQVVYVPMQVQAAYCQPGTVPSIVPTQPPQVAQQSQQQTRFSERAPQSIIQAACLKCHGGAKVEHNIDFRNGLTCDQKLDAVALAATGEMPKGGSKLSPEQFAQLKKEIAALKSPVASTGENDAE